MFHLQILCLEEMIHVLQLRRMVLYSLGDGKINGDSLGTEPRKKMRCQKKLGRVLEGKVVVQLAASNCHVLALTKEGEIYT
jgi:alpha-tubulin suppressor-like RCC1 family protein